MGKPMDSSELRRKEEVQKRFGKRLSELRNSKDMTQENFAFELEVDRTYVSYIERGKRNPSLFMLSKIAKALRVNLSELFEKV
jgi:transcriptional regulator with XRE-family HTH domain